MENGLHKKEQQIDSFISRLSRRQCSKGQLFTLRGSFQTSALGAAVGGGYVRRTQGEPTSSFRVAPLAFISSL